MSRITIVPEDGVVIVDGRAVQGLDLSDIHPTVHAVQWFGTHGWVEYVWLNDQVLDNQPITDLSSFQPALDAWQVAVDAEELEALRPYPSWVLNAAGDAWEPPAPQPGPGYAWDETLLAWRDQAEWEADLAHKAELEARYAPTKIAAAYAAMAEALLQPLVVADTLTAAQVAALAPLFESFRVGVAYAPPKVLEFKGALYEVKLPHTSQADWTPDVATTLFTRHYPDVGGIQNWQPWDNHNDSLHQIGDEVMHAGKHWRATVGNNHWVPGEFGWEEVV